MALERRLETEAEAHARRERDRLRKQASRARLAQLRFADYEEWTFGYGENDSWADRFPECHAELRNREDEFAAAVSAELGRDISRDLDADFTVNRVIVCLVALQKKERPWMCRTTEGFVACGRYVIDSIASGLIYSSYRCGLRQSSQTYAQALHELLTLLNQFDFPHGMARSEKLVIEQELSGTYTYVPPPPPKKAPEPVIELPKEKPMPSTDEILLEQRVKLGGQLRDDLLANQNLDPAARRFLEGF